MTITQIYDRFSLPQKLREHMLNVAQLASLIADNWTEKSAVNPDFIIKAGLLHDLANIVKFNLADNSDLKAKQVEIIAKYGKDDHQATEKMLREIGINDTIIDLVQNKSLSNAINIASSSDWNLKILFYSDMRIAPSGITSLDHRLSELVSRSEKYRTHQQLPELISSAKTVESQIQSQTQTDLSQISNPDLSDSPINPSFSIL